MPTTHYETKPLTNNHKRDSTDKHARTGNTATQAETENAHSPGRSQRTKEKEAERNRVYVRDGTLRPRTLFGGGATHACKTSTTSQ